MDKLFIEVQKKKIWGTFDIRFANFLMKFYDFDVFFLLAMLSYSINSGNICFFLENLVPNKLFNGLNKKLAFNILNYTGKKSIFDWKRILLKSDIVGDGSILTPIVLDKNKLYLYKMWKYECIVCNFFSSSRLALLNKKKIQSILDKLFSVSKKLDYQKIAVSIALINKVSIIFGGPGTGKTFIIIKIFLAFLYLYKKNNLDIRIVTPTGKSASRLRDAFGVFLNKRKNLFYKNFCFFPKISTIHSLLGISFGNNICKYNKYNKLYIDLLIVDEASMIDLFIMSRLILAIHKKTKVVFLGDHCQLPSINSGSILKDIFFFAKNVYTIKQQNFLADITRCSYFFFKNINNSLYTISNSLCVLKKNYRFSENSEIGKLSNLFRFGRKKKILDFIFNNKNKNIYFYDILKLDSYIKIIDHAIFFYKKFLLKVKHRKSPKIILKKFEIFRLFSSIRDGIFGVVELNKKIEERLQFLGLISIKLYNDFIGNYYIGKPVMILRNSKELNLYNGDIGIILYDKNKFVKVFFKGKNNTIRSIPINYLPKHETAYVMTVHKSQGSEFLYVSLVLINNFSKILTRELLYTAITRAKKSVTLFSSKKNIIDCVNTTSNRFSGIIDRLYKKNCFSCDL